MTPIQRRAWRERVYAADLTGDQKVVILALAEFANFADGTNARPGVERLKDMCELKERAVRYALRRAVELGLIEQTGSANGKRGIANVYRLLATGTVMPPVPALSAQTTGTAVPPDCETTGTNTSQPPARIGQTTGTAMPPTYIRPNHEQGRARVDDEPRCWKHRDPIEFSIPPGCNDCKQIRLLREAEDQAAAIDADARAEEARVAALAARKRCRDCDEDGFEFDEHGEPSDYARKCRHPNLLLQQAAP